MTDPKSISEDELLILARKDMLNPEQRRRFDSLIERSLEHRLMYEAALGFDAADQALSGDDEIAKKLVTAAMNSAAVNPTAINPAALGSMQGASHQSLNSPGSFSSRRLAKRASLPVLAIALIASSAAAAAGYQSWKAFSSNSAVSEPTASEPTVSEPAIHETLAQGAAHRPSPAESSALKQAAELAEQSGEDSNSEEAPNLPLTSASSAAVPPVARLAEAQPSSNRPSSKQAASSTLASAVDQPDPVKDLSERYSTANLMRRQGRLNEATLAYKELIQRYPSSREAVQSQLTLGEIYLSSGNTSAALKQFDQYLSANGPSRASALWGKARAQELSLGSAAAKATLLELIRNYPNTPQAAGARQKLQLIDDSSQKPSP